MIITKTPFRISFFGGGTDFPEWYRENGGAVISTTIDKYCYISCRYLPPFFEYRNRLVYSKYEHFNEIDEIKHPSVRECLRFMEITDGLEIHHDGDLPARTGLASSSAFTVGLLKTLYALRGQMVSKKSLVEDALHVEQMMIKEAVGSQDQVAVAYGGLNKIEFSGEHEINVQPLTLLPERLVELQSHLMLYFTGFTRKAVEIEQEKLKSLSSKAVELRTMHSMVDESISILNSMGDIGDFGRLLHESWALKRSLAKSVSNDTIDSLYDSALAAGALGGKLLGAGGGGFMLLFAPPERQAQIRAKLSNLLLVPFSFETAGSQVMVYQPSPSYCVDGVCK